jgi:hypothetical protein
MLRFIPLRLAILVVLASVLLPASSFAQSQDSQSVAEAARRARAKKKNSEKPAKVITDDTLEVKKGDVQSATAEQLRMPGTPVTQGPPPAANAPSSANQTEKASDNAQEVAALKEQIKQAQSDLDLLRRQLSLEQDNYFSQPDYTHDTAGKAKVDGIKQQVGDAQQALDRLKAKLAQLQPAQSAPPAAPPKP